MSRTISWALWIVGLACLVLFLWFDVTNEPRRFALHVGRPTPWYTYESDDHGFRSELTFLTLGAAAGILGVLAISAARWKGSCCGAPANRSPPAQGNSF